MKLKNEALQKLYDTFVHSVFGSDASEQSIIGKAFKECDEELSDSVAFAHIKDLRDRNDILERTNESLLGANLDLATKKRQLENQVMQTTETLEKVNADRNELQRNIDILSASEWEAISANKKLEKELERTRKDYDELFEENRKLKARTDCLRYEVEWYRKHYKEKSDKIQELKSTLNSMCGDEYIKKLQDSVSKNCYDQGQTDLWVKLQNVNDSQPFELATCFPDVTGMEDIISWDLEDFLDAYKKWWEEKEKERIKHMRDYLDRFCRGRLCSKCPLHADDFKCEGVLGFNNILDEDLPRYYEKARSCGAYNLKDGKLFIHDLSHPMAGVNEAIKNACDRFTKPVEAANINISTRAWHGDATAEKIKIEPWSCTLEGTINVEFDRDLLEKVCGVKPDDKK